MKDKDGKKTSNREDILKKCEHFYRELYDKTIKAPPIQTTSSADTEKPPPFTEREVEAYLKDMSKNKTSGPDQITSDVYKLGGEQIIKCLTKCYNIILETQTIPPRWNEAKLIRETQATSRITGRPVFLPVATNSSTDFLKRE
ncbi:endonuclease-reverse transcriptase [Elysia marginata]|uniref:Endonuclease-reverse transcriptase n=1 Tax=Elysia marginata TaxID=1093978 RepID=A0AAV4EWB0_9GAST|nr:endonuclease-reverse transcriptase [Elysia marginata]